MAEVDAATSAQPSKLFASVFDGFAPEHRITVLDVGLGLPESLDFFSAYRCRLHFLDLFDEPVVRDPQHEVGDAQLQQRFADLLQFPVGTRIDICLFWDFLNYLDKRALRAFSAALKPWLHAGTRAHGMGVLNDQTALPYREYGILALNQFKIRPRQGVQGACYPHPQAQLLKHLEGFEMHRALLLSDGRLELLLDASLEALDFPKKNQLSQGDAGLTRGPCVGWR